MRKGGQDMAKTLTVFFSRAGENYFGGAMRTVSVGNTERVVRAISELIETERKRIEGIDCGERFFRMTRVEQETNLGAS